MPISEEEIRAMLAADEETGTVEFKIKAPRPGELAERICGMANSRTGGTILFGVEDATRDPVGLTRPHETIDGIWKALRMVKPAVPLLDEEPQVVTVDGATLVVLRIAPNNGELYQSGGVFWIRKGSETRPMTREEIEARLGTFGSIPWERRLCPEATLADLDLVRLDQYLAHRGEASRERRRYTSVEDQLLGLHAAARDPSTGTIRPTHAGMLFFGQDPQYFLPQSEIVCVRFADSLGVGQFVDRKNLTGTLPELISKAADFITLHTRQSAQIQGFWRADRPEYPIEALREAVVNAVAHRDYSLPGEAIRVFFYADRVEVHSPGLLLPGITPADLAAMRVPSRPRNPLLTQLLRDLPGYMERIGAGIKLMVQEMRRLGLPDPEFREQHEVVVLFRNGQTAPPAPTETINNRQVIGLRWVQEHGSMNLQEYCGATGTAERTAQHDLRDLVDQGLLVRRGKARAVRYYLP